MLVPVQTKILHYAKQWHVSFGRDILSKPGKKLTCYRGAKTTPNPAQRRISKPSCGPKRSLDQGWPDSQVLGG